MSAAGQVEASAKWSTAFASATPEAMSAYDESMVGAVFEPLANMTLKRLAVDEGERLPDVATAPRTVARLAAAQLGPTGSVTATDISEAMPAAAASKPAVEGGAVIEYRRTMSR